MHRGLRLTRSLDWGSWASLHAVAADGHETELGEHPRWPGTRFGANVSGQRHAEGWRATDLYVGVVVLDASRYDQIHFGKP
jgi:hypothetical protein